MHGLLTYVVVVCIRREKALGRLTPDPATGPAFSTIFIQGGAESICLFGHAPSQFFWCASSL
jgi:hypothetical protein